MFTLIQGWTTTEAPAKRETTPEDSMITKISSLLDNVSHVKILVIRLLNVLHTKPSWLEKQENKGMRQELRRTLIITSHLLMIKLNAHFAITLDMKNLNARANYRQHLKRNKYQQILRYGKGRSYSVKVVV